MRSRHLVATLVARGISAGGVIIVTLLVARTASVESAAQIFLFMAAASGLAIVARFGTDLHIIRHVASNETGQSLRGFFQTLIRLLIVSTLIASLFWSVYAVLSPQGLGEGRAYFLLVPVLATLINGSHTASAWLKGSGRPVLGSVFEASGFYFFMVPLLLFTPLLTPSIFFLQAIAVCAFVCFVAVWMAARGSYLQNPKQPSCTEVKANGFADWAQLARVCLPLALIAVLSFVSQWGMLFMVEHQDDPKLLSELNILLRLLSPLIFVQLTMDSFLAPKFAAAKTADELRRLRWLGILAIVAIAIPVSLPIWLFPTAVVTVLFGDNYAGLANQAPWAFLLLFLIFSLGSNGIMLAVREWQVHLLLFSAIRALVVVSLTILLIPRFGVMGGLLAYLLGLCVQSILARVYVDRFLRLMKTSVS